MRKKLNFKSFILIASTFSILSLSGACGQNDLQTAQKIEGLENLGAISVIARESGSGTHEVFSEVTGLIKTNPDGSKVDYTSSDAKIKMNAESVIEEVKED